MCMGEWMIVKSEDDILHYGMPKRSGRYPYGSGDRPFQSTGGKKPGFFKKRKEAKKKKEAQEKAKQAAAEKRAFEASKKRAIESGDTKFIYENRAKLTDEEIQRAISRIDMKKTLESYNISGYGQTPSQPQPSGKKKNKGGGSDGGNQQSQQPVKVNKKGKPYVNIKDKYPGLENLMGNVKTINEWMNIGLNAYGNYKKVMDALNGIAPKKEEKKKS